MKKNSIVKNYIYNLSYQILAIIIPIITIPYLSRVLGAENIGIYSFTLSITTYFILFGSVGVDMYGQREIAYVQGDFDNRSNIFWEIFIIKFMALTISIIIFFFIFCIDGEYSVFYKILSLEIIANAMDIAWFFKGIEEFKKTVMRNMLAKLVSLICIFLFVKTSNDLWKYLLIYVLSTSIGNLSVWIYLPKYIKRVNFRSLSFKKHFKPVLLLFIPQIATQIYTVLDKTMIGIIISNKSEVGYYEQAQKIIKLLITIATALGTVMMPRIAASYSTGNVKKIKEYMYKSFSFILFVSFPLSLGLISVSYNFVPIFYGSGYDKVAPLLCVMSPVMIIIGLSNVVGIQYLLPTKQQNKYTISVIAGALINVIFNIVLINFFASIGAAISTIIAELVVLMSQLILTKNELNIKDVFQISKKYFIASMIMFVISISLSCFINNYYISIMVQVIVSAIIYLVILFLLKDDLLLDIIKRIKIITVKLKKRE